MGILAKGRQFMSAMVMSSILACGVAHADEQTRIVAAENMYGKIAEAIGGKFVVVTSIISSPTEDPHLFEAQPTTAEALKNAQIVIYNGIGYDDWMKSLLEKHARQDLHVIVAADLVSAANGDNPHLWYKPETAPKIAAALAQQLEKAQPDHTEAFKSNLAAFEAALKPVDEKIAALRSQYEGTVVAATEPVFGYMAAALGLKMENKAFQDAVMKNAEPSPAEVQAFEKGLSDGKIRVLFYNSQVTDPATARILEIAKSHHVPVVGVTETAPKDKSFADWMLAELSATETALTKAKAEKHAH